MFYAYKGIQIQVVHNLYNKFSSMLLSMFPNQGVVRSEDIIVALIFTQVLLDSK